MDQPSSYMNRMESARAAETLVTPRSGYEFDDEQGSIRRGVAVRSDHPCVAANRGAFMHATDGCHLHPSAERTAAKPKRAPKAPLSETASEE